MEKATMKKPAITIAAAVIFVIFSGYWAYNGFSTAGMLFFACAAALSAVLYVSGESVILNISLPALSLVFTCFLCSADLTAFLAPVPYAAGLIFAVLHRKKTKRTDILIYMSIFLFAVFSVWFIIQTAASGNTVSAAYILSRIEASAHETADYIAEAQNEYSRIFDSEAAAVPPELYANIYSSLLLLTPALIVCMLNIISFFTTGIIKIVFNLFFLITKNENYKTDRKNWRVSVSFISAIILTIVIILSMTARSNADIVYISVISNLALILSLNFSLIGLYVLIDKYKQYYGSSVGKFILSVFFSVILCVLINFSVIYILIFIGLITTELAQFKKLKEKLNKMTESDDDDE